MDYISQLSLNNILILAAGGLSVYSLASRILDRRRSDVHRLVKPVSSSFPAVDMALTALIKKNAHWLWGHEKHVWESVESQYQIQVVKERGHTVSLKGALLVSPPSAFA